LQAQILRDEAVDTRLLVRLTNAQSRALAALGALATKAEKACAEGPTPAQYLARKAAARQVERQAAEGSAEPREVTPSP
jgi:hypothetical protein